jgi:16S rRNA (guanine527-N7)-methyltransferase
MTANAQAQIAQNVSRETFARLSAYVDLLCKWNAKINLIGPDTDIWSRHISDSLQLVKLIPETAKTMADLGSGAGLPGLVIAIAKPELAVTLVEQDQRKSAFLHEAVRVLELRCEVLALDLHKLDRRFDLVTARALAPLRDLCAMAFPIMGTGAICLFPKGRNFATEVEEAGKGWRFLHRLTPSTTNGESCIVSLTELSPRG